MKYLSELSNRIDYPTAAISVGIILICVVGYYMLRRRMLGSHSNLRELIRFKYIAAGIALLAIIVIMRVWFRGVSGETHELQQNFLYTALSGIVVYLMGIALQGMLAKRAESLEMRHKAKRAIAWTGLFVFIVSALFIWSGNIGDASVFLGIVGAGVALSLQETILCMAGWLLIMFKKPYDIGDRVELNGQMGDVIDIGLFQTSMLEVGNWVRADQSTGRLLIIPNSNVFRHTVINYTKGFPFIWNELSVVVTYESDWLAAKDILLRQAGDEADKIETEVNNKIKQMQKQYAIHYGHFKPIVYTSIVDSGIKLTLRYLTPVRQRRTTEHRISEAVISDILPHQKIDFAYPTTRIYRNTEEGKSVL